MAAVLVAVVAAVLLVALGAFLAWWWQRQEFARLSELRQVVNGEVVAMQQIQRINEAYFEARDQLRHSGRPHRVWSGRVPPADRQAG